MVLGEAEVQRLDQFVLNLMQKPRPDHMALYRQAEEKRREAFDRMIWEGVSWGEASGAHPILNKEQASFKNELKAIDNDLSSHLDIIEHYLPAWFSAGEFPPPYYAMRIAIILRKSKQFDREKQFLIAYLKHFRSEFGGSRADEKLVERATKLGARLMPIA